MSWKGLVTHTLSFCMHNIHHIVTSSVCKHLLPSLFLSTASSLYSSPSSLLFAWYPKCLFLNSLTELNYWFFINSVSVTFDVKMTPKWKFSLSLMKYFVDWWCSDIRCTLENKYMMCYSYTEVLIQITHICGESKYTKLMSSYINWGNDLNGSLMVSWKIPLILYPSSI